jgi:hypothetical protein
VDVYELIIERGTIGALKYANQIENKNFKLANQIDDAVLRLCKNAGMIRTAEEIPDIPWDYAGSSSYSFSPPPLQNNPSYNYSPPASQNYPSTLSDNKSNSEPQETGSANPFFGAAGSVAIPLAKFKAWKNWRNFQYAKKIEDFKNLLKMGNHQAAIEMLNNAPKEFSQGFRGGLKGFLDPVKVRQQFLNEARNTLVDAKEYQNFIHDAAGSMKNSLNESLRNHKVLKKIPKAIPKAIHPAVENFDFLSKDQKKSLRGKSIEEVKEIFKKSKDPKYLQNFKSHIAKGGKGFEAAEKLLQETPSKNAGILKQGFQLLAEKFPLVGKVMPVLEKFLGPIAVFLEGKGFFEELNEYGWDNKTKCNLASFLTGAATVLGIPQLAPIWGIVSIGCMFVHHGPKKLAPDEKNKADTSDINDENVNALVGKVQISDLSQKDQELSQQMYDQYKDNEEQLIKEFNSAANGGKFDNPVSVLAGVDTQLNNGKFFK